MSELRELEERMDQYDQVRERIERRCRKLQSEIDSYKVEIQRLRVEHTEPCEDVAASQKVAFEVGWQGATGYYSGKQVWNLERCWEQFLKDKEEEAK